MVFATPAILWISLAVAAPVLIHLLMRSRPRKVVFPALQFVAMGRKASIRMYRLRHFLLMSLRMLGIVLAALLFAGAAFRGVASDDLSAMSSAVVIIDNSASMNYKSLTTGRTPIAIAGSQAQKLLESFPSGVKTAVLISSDGGASAGLSSIDDARRQLANVVPGYGSENLSACISSAVSLLTGASPGKKAIYIFTDMTARAWDGVVPSRQGGIDYCVVDCGWRGNSNVALLPPEISDGIATVGMDVQVLSAIQATAMFVETQLVTRVDGRDIDSRGVELKSGQTLGASTTIPIRGLNLLQGSISVDVRDGLEADNVRYFTIPVVAKPSLLTVHDVACPPGASAEFLMSNAISPRSSICGLANVSSVSSDRLDGEAISSADIILLAGVSVLTDEQWRTLESAVRQGKSVWVIAGKSMSGNSYNSSAAARIFPVSIGMFSGSQLPWRFDDSGLKDPMVLPFSGGDNPPLSAVKIFGRMVIDKLWRDSRVILNYSDGVPAIVLRRTGKGQVLFWNFSPESGMSNLGGLGQFVVLCQRAFRLMTVDSSRNLPASYWGRLARVDPPGGFAAHLAIVRAPSGSERNVRCDSAGGVDVFTDELGNWTITFVGENQSARRGMSVNVDPAESDLSPADEGFAKKCFPPGNVVEGSDVIEIRQSQMHDRIVDMAVPILVVLLLVVAAESILSNHFYKTDGPGGKNGIENRRVSD